MTIREGQAEAFAATMDERGLAILRAAAGVTSVSLGRGVENPDKFMLLVGWEAMSSHDAYGGSDAQARFRAVIGPFVIRGAMEHFEMA